MVTPSAKANPPPTLYTLSSLKHLTRTQLAPKVLAASTDPSSLAIVDVRDSDYIGGHITGALNFPAANLEWRMPELLRVVKDKKLVVFHCMLSQQRGPGAAIRYLRAREERDRLEREKKAEEQEEGGDKEGEEKVVQQVYVLDGGFMKWQEKYVHDQLIEKCSLTRQIWQR
jgi:rhodanese-related sulfurtransferase